MTGPICPGPDLGCVGVRNSGLREGGREKVDEILADSRNLASIHFFVAATVTTFVLLLPSHLQKRGRFHELASVVLVAVQ